MVLLVIKKESEAIRGFKVERLFNFFYTHFLTLAPSHLPTFRFPTLSPSYPLTFLFKKIPNFSTSQLQ